MTYVEKMPKQQFKDPMLFLLEMGYNDYQKNETLLTKYNGKLDLVANVLASMP